MPALKRPELGLILEPSVSRATTLLNELKEMWCNFKFEGVLFRSDSRHNDRGYSLLQCAKKQAVMTVAQWHRHQLIRGLWLLAKKVEDVFMLTWCNFKFDGVLFNLDTYRRM